MQNVIKVFLKRCLWIAIILFALRCFISFNEVKNNGNLYLLFGYAGEAIGTTTLLGVIYEKIIWKKDKTLKIPVLKSKYTGILKSEYDGKERDAELHIKQTLFSIRVIMKTDESSSNSLSCSIDNIYGEDILTYTYINTPKTEFRNRSEIHYGTAILKLDEINQITGTYYTDRNTRGDLKFNSCII